MSAARRDPPDRAKPGSAPFAERLVLAGRRLVAENHEGVIVAGALGCFAALWMLYDTISLAPVDLRWDASEASLWAQHFAFGYKHPPMTGWLFALWFAVFPRADWAEHLLYLTMAVATLAVAWRLLRDHLDKDRALFGLAALFVVPLYTVKTAELNANTVMMPFWAAALLFYLRARRGLGAADAFLAGAFASLAVLGKYWAVFLLAGMAVASVVGRRDETLLAFARAVCDGGRRGDRPRSASVVDADPKRRQRSVRRERRQSMPFSAALAKSANYFVGAVAYIIGPLIFFVALRPSRAAWLIRSGRLKSSHGKRGSCCWSRSCSRRWSTWPFRIASLPRGRRPIGRCCRSSSTACSRFLIDEGRDRAGGPGDACGDARHSDCFAGHRLRKAHQTVPTRTGRISSKWRKSARASLGGRSN